MAMREGILEDVGLSNTCGAYQQQITFVYSGVVRNGRVFGYVELDGGVGSGAGICGLMALVYGLVVARKLIWVSGISTR